MLLRWFVDVHGAMVDVVVIIVAILVVVAVYLDDVGYVSDVVVVFSCCSLCY